MKAEAGAVVLVGIDVRQHRDEELGLLLLVR